MQVIAVPPLSPGVFPVSHLPAALRDDLLASHCSAQFRADRRSHR